MFGKRFYRALAVATAMTLTLSSVALADDLNADADALATQVPHGNSETATQHPGTTVAYDFSALVDETGNDRDNVFPGQVDVDITASGDWLATNALSTAILSFTAYNDNEAGTVSIFVPCDTAADTAKTMTVTLTPRASTNGQRLGTNPITLSYNITAQGSNAASCVSTPANLPPTVDAGGPYSGAEGSNIALTGGSASDSDGSVASSTWSIVDDSGVAPGSCAITNATSLTGATISCTDNGSATVRLTAVDDDGASSSDDATVNVSNAAPVFDTGKPAFASSTVSCLDRTATLNFSFSDAGAADTHSGTIDFGDGSGSRALTSTELANESASHTYNSGSYTATVTITDDDGDSTSSTGNTAGLTVLYNDSGIRQPINADGTSVFKLGSTIPVKIQFTDCDGMVISTLAPTVDLRKVDTSTGTVVTEAPPAASADAGNVMRWSADGAQYIFNLSTKRSQFAAGGDLTNGTYELKIYVGTQLYETVQFDIKK